MSLQTKLQNDTTRNLELEKIETISVVAPCTLIVVCCELVPVVKGRALPICQYYTAYKCGDV